MMTILVVAAIIGRISATKIRKVNYYKMSQGYTCYIVFKGSDTNYIYTYL